MFLNFLDRIIISFDNSLKTLAGKVEGTGRLYPVTEVDAMNKSSLSKRKISIEQMRINHTGEICAQALYHSQFLFSQDIKVNDWLVHAAQEEQDHLIWCARRLDELGGRPSYLNGLFYASSYMMGATLSAMSVELNLGFIRATEDLVCEHLQRQLTTLDFDISSRQIIEAMIQDEAEHSVTAESYGGVEFSPYLYDLMRLQASFMKVVVSKV